MKTNNIVLLIFSFLISFSAYTQQNVEFDKDNFPDDQRKQLRDMVKQIKKGDKLLENEPPVYSEALEYYLVVNDFNPHNAMLNYKIGLCYLNSMQKTKAIPYLEMAFKLDPVVVPDILYLQARAYHYNYEFDRAVDYYTRYKNSLTPNELTKYADNIKKKIKECENGKVLVNNPIRVFIDNLGNVVNTEYPEYNPVINSDETVLMFTSCRPETTGGDIDPLYNIYYEDIYISYKEGDVWTKAINPGKPFNNDSHDAIVGLSPDAKNVLIYKGDVGGGDIFICRIEDGEWQRPKDLPKEINTNFHETSASFSPDMRALFFVSDKEGGYGGSDIYVARVSEKSKPGKFDFEDPGNIGSVINTMYDEEGVFMQADGRTLYFSSEGHNSMGGYDIFKTRLENGQWSVPENLGYPVNTPDDDFFFSVNSKGDHGYYSSFDKEGPGKQDLFMVTFLGPEKPVINELVFNYLAFEQKPVKETRIAGKVELEDNALVMLKGKILDQITHSPLSVLVEIIDNETNRMIASFVSNERDGSYMVSLPSGKTYGIAVKAKEYLFHSENIVIPPTTVYQVVNKDIYLKKVEIGSKIVLKNIFFEYNKAVLQPESIPELERLVKLLNDVPTLKLEISGHTDNVGSQAYNVKLSEERAKAVVDYLVGKGISPDRLTYRGYGFSQPIADNSTEEGRAMNRRTEFKILSR